MSDSTNSDLQWKGYAVHDTKKWDEFKVIDIKPKTFEEDDIDIKIAYCGVCGSDVHTITGGWGDVILPIVTGHEIAGHVVRVGKNVKGFKVGDRAGVGAMCGSCYECKSCKNDNEQYCKKPLGTYNSKYADGTPTTGGYSTAIRCNERFVFPIPDKLTFQEAAPMMCGGLTVYSPLVRNGCGPGKKVGIVGIGGLGHYALQFAKALGAEVHAFSRSLAKEKDARELGADFVHATAEKGFSKSIAGELDLIICTADVSAGIPLHELLTCLDVHGKLINVAVPENPLPQLSAFDLISNGVLLGGSCIGSKKEAIEMLSLAVDKGVKSWIEELPMCEAGKAVRNVKENKVRYRHVLKVDL